MKKANVCLACSHHRVHPRRICCSTKSLSFSSSFSKDESLASGVNGESSRLPLFPHRETKTQFDHESNSMVSFSGGIGFGGYGVYGE
jgi:hypothetical protein